MKICWINAWIQKTLLLHCYSTYCMMQLNIWPLIYIWNRNRMRCVSDGVSMCSLWQRTDRRIFYGAGTFSHQSTWRTLILLEKRIPHDGKFKILFNGQEIDLRISSFPSIHAKKLWFVSSIVPIIWLHSTNWFFWCDACLIQNITFPVSGFFLVSGPTGSGKRRHCMQHFLL